MEAPASHPDRALASVRVAERDENGNVIGNRLGVEGIDWHYELRWYPPTPVNADGGVAPAVRDLN